MSKTMLEMSNEEIIAYVDSLRAGRSAAVQTKLLGKIKEKQSNTVKQALRTKTDEASDILKAWAEGQKDG